MKNYLLACLLSFITAFSYAQTATLGDYRSVASGTWSTASNWQVRDGAALGSGTWVTASTAPLSTNNVYIQAGTTITVDVAGVCNDLHINNTSGSLVIGANSVSVSGKLRCYAGTAIVTGIDDIFYTQTPVNTGLSAALITSSTGALRFVGGSRPIISGATTLAEWGSNGTTLLGFVEFSLDPGAIGTLSAGIKSKKIRISSGIVSAGSSNTMATGTAATDSFVVKTGAKFITARTGNNAIGNSSSTTCALIVVEANATMEFTANAQLDTKSFVNYGTVIYSGAAQNLVVARSGTLAGADSLNNYVNLVLSGTGAKSIFAGGTVTVSDTLKLEGTSAALLALGVGSKLTYGANATLVFNSSTATWTLLQTSVEWPATGGPKNVEIRKNKIQFCNCTGASRIITGSLILNGGTFNINQGDSLYMSNNSSLIKKSSSSTSIIDWNSTTTIGYFVIGSLPTDVVNIIIDANASLTEGKELKISAVGYVYKGKLNLTIGNNTNYSITGGRTIYNFSNSGILTLNSTNTFKIQGNVTGNGTITGLDTASITLDSVHTGSTQILRFTPGYNRINNLVFDRVGGTLTSTGPFTIQRTLSLKNGIFNDNGFVDTVKGSISRGSTITSSHESGAGGKIVAAASAVDPFQRSIDSLSFGNLEIAGNYTCGGLTVTGDLTLASGTADCNANTMLAYGNIYGSGTQSGGGRVKMIGSGKTVSGATFSTLEIASSGTITATDTTRINTALAISSGIFNDGGNAINVSGNIQGPGKHVSTGSGKIKMIAGTKAIAVNGIEFGNLDVSLASPSSVVSALTPFTVNNNLTITNGTLVDSGNTIIVKGNLTGTSTTNSSHTGSGEIKLTGTSNTISNIKVDSLEIASGANITALTDFKINKDLLLNGTINDGGNIISIYGSIIGSGLHTGTGKISMFGSSKSIIGGTRINNIEIASGASISPTPPAVGCSAFISGTLSMNGNNLGVDTGNILTMKNGSRIIRKSGNLNLNGGSVKIGEDSSDVIQVVIQGVLASSNELPSSHVGNIDLTIDAGATDSLSNNKFVRKLILNEASSLNVAKDNSGNINSYSLKVADTVNVLGNSTLIDAELKVLGTLYFGGTAKTLTTNDKLTIVSTATATARVAEINNSNTINGRASVERFIQNKKAWRLLFMPTKHDYQTIKEAWQEGANDSSYKPSGYGIQITGGSSTAWSDSGFDKQTSTPSVKTYNPASNNWEGIPSTHVRFDAAKAYMAFVRGDRTVTSFGQSSNSTLLREKGSLNIGDITWNNLGTAGNQFVAIGNPYPSAISLKNVTTVGLDSSYYLWDPLATNSIGYGGFQTFTLLSNGQIQIAPGGASYNGTNTNIESGQGFFVHTNNGPGSITFHETDKATGSNLVARIPGQISSIRTNLFKNSNNQIVLMDGVLNIYDEAFSNDVNTADAKKLMNPTENLGIKQGGQLLAIERRHAIDVNDSVFYNISQMKMGNYKFDITPEYIDATSISAYLIDRFIHVSYPVSLTNPASISFDITSDTGSYASNRFVLVFNYLRTTPVHFVNVKASLIIKDILVEWNVENEVNIKEYKVEKSSDGIHFVEAASLLASNAANYSWIDHQPAKGINYYRIQSVGLAGDIGYSKIAKLSIQADVPGFTISPNPIEEDKLANLYLNQLPFGAYQLTLFDLAGRKIFTKNWMHQTDENKTTIKLPKSVLTGVYNLVLTNDAQLKIVEKIVIR